MVKDIRVFKALRQMFASDAPSQMVYPPAPEGWVLFVIGDVHGRSDCLDRAHLIIEKELRGLGEGQKYVEIYLGDLIDRGQDSAGVLERLVQRAQKIPLRVTKGNHELMMEAFLQGTMDLEEWKLFGGTETLLSYGLDRKTLLLDTDTVRNKALAAVPASHRDFLAKALPYLKLGEYCFVHAGIRPEISLGEQKLDDLTWIRQEFLDYDGTFGFIVVHGHTPVKAVEFKKNRINLDTGAYVTNNLSVLKIDGNGAYLLKE